ncbi:hypothetical protein, partial [Staphylococcus epidermidis]|uniref:hypothetical protein n=1 Tax=Staphylococcus epidermidis TaxID=1282 RepID=UPI001C92F2DA
HPQTKFQRPFIPTNDRLIINLHINPQFYYPNIPYHQINQIHFHPSHIIFHFNIPTLPMPQIKTQHVQAFLDYI